VYFFTTRCHFPCTAALPPIVSEEDHMKRRLLTGILFLAMFSAIQAAPPVYNFSYTIQADIRKTIALVYKFRMFFKAVASADFTGNRSANGDMTFALKTIDKTSYRVRTHRKGEKLSAVTADYTFEKAISFYDRAIADFYRSATDYRNMIKDTDRRAFQIAPTTPDSLGWSRNANGANASFKQSIKYITEPNRGAYNDSFNVYELMIEMARLYNHSCFDEGGLDAAIKDPSRQWLGAPLNLTRNLNKITLEADFKSAEYLDFDQDKPFRLRYRVASVDKDVIMVIGEAKPNIDAGMGLKIREMRRTVRYRISDKTLLEDTLLLRALNSDNRGWYLSCALRIK
jgi:hypothetical protein